MANRMLRFDYKELPRLLQEFVKDISVGSDNDSSDDPREFVTEMEYYRAFESLLQYRHYRETCQGDNTLPSQLTEEQNRELADFHLNKCLSAWVDDHDAHKKYAYYPSSAYPMGSTMEYTFFMRQWVRNVNYPHVRRLYDRSGDFENVLAKVDKDLCPCKYLVEFNVIDNIEYKLDEDGHVLCLISVENELMMRSEFFNKRKEYFQTFNMWLYDRFLNQRATVFELRPDGDSNVSFYRHLRYKVRAKKPKLESTSLGNDSCTVDRNSSSYSVDSLKKKRPSTVDTQKRKRLQNVREKTSRLLFGSTEKEKTELLVRLEDYRSRLYSPRLKNTSCQHSEEDITYEQRRCGDEIKTEIRTCKKCGRVKVITN